MTGTGGSGALVSPAADATARSRWRSLVLTDPVARLVRNAAHAGIDDSAYDLRQLALAAVDLVVGSMGFARETVMDEVVDTLTSLAARMRPAQEWAQEWQDVAQAVLKGLLNDAHEQRRFTYYFAEIGSDIGGAGETRWEPYSFRLLSLRDTEFGAVLVASDQAITLYLHGLDVDLEDADRALAHVLQRQLEDQRFDAAARTAAQAERTSVGLSATLTELLDATRRDVGSTDWATDLPERLTRARRHVEARIAEDDRLLEHVQGGLDAETSPAVRAVSGQIVDLVGRAKQVHLDLERRLVGARDVFLAAQVRQRIARRRRLRMFTVGEDVLGPALALPVAAAVPVVEAFANRALGVTVPRLVRFDDLLDALWAVPRAPEPVPADAEDRDESAPGDDPQGYPAAVMDAAQDVLTRVDEGPVRLSALLDDVDGSEGAGDVAELVLLSALWAFAPDPDDPTGTDEDAGAEVGVLAGGLVAHDDGTPLRHALAGGRDLLVSRRGSAAARAADETGGRDRVTSMAADLTDVRAAAELITFGLARRARPVEGSDYRVLLDRYRSELRFKDVVDTMAEGLGLEVLGTPRAGIVLVPEPGGPFATRLGDLRPMDQDEKLVFGLVLVAVAAYAYPNEVDFDDPETKLVDVIRIDEFLRGAIAALAPSDAGLDGRARAAAEVYADLPSFVPTQTGRRARGCTLRAVEEVCAWLVDQGAAREAPTLGPDTYHLTDRFRLLVADSAGSAALEALREVRREARPEEEQGSTQRPARSADRAQRGSAMSAADVMWKIRRVRLDRIGPSAARFLDVELDFRNNDGDPLDTILWLRNGGGKSTVLSLICALIRPGRRDFLATAATGKHLEDYVLGSDTAHVVVEWSGPSGRKLVTGAVYEWADRSQPADPNRDHDRLNARWYVFSPADGRAELDLLPFRTDGRQTPLQEFAAAVRKWDAVPGCGAAVTKEADRWRRLLDEHGLDTAIFTPILQMNATEGGIEGQFQFRNADQFVQYLLELIVDPEVPGQVSQILEGVRTGLAERPELVADMTFAEEATPRLRALAAAGEERDRAAEGVTAREAGARRIAGRLAAAVTWAEREQAERVAATEQLDADAAGHAEARARAERAAGRHRRVAAELRLAAARAGGERCAAEAARIGARLAAWQATPAVHALREAERRVVLLEEQLAAATEEAEPLRRRRDRAAAAYAGALDESIRVLDEEIGQQRVEAELEREQELAARKRGEEALADRGRLDAQLGSVEAMLAALDRDLAAAVTGGHLRAAESVPAAVERHRAADSDADALLARLGRDRQELAAERTRIQGAIAALGEQRRTVERDRDAAAGRLRELQERVAELAEDNRLLVLGGGDEIDPPAEAGDLAEVVSRAVARTDRRRIELAVDGAEDERALAALAATGLLPGGLDLVHAQDALERAGIAATSGWSYLADSVPAEHRSGVLRAAPALATGLLVYDERDLAGAREAVTGAALRPTSAVVLATTAELGAVVEEVRTGRLPTRETPFLVPPAAALTDRAAAGDELTAREEARAARSRSDAELAAQRDRDADLLRRLRELRADCPPGTLDDLAAAVADASSQLDGLAAELAQAEAAAGAVTEREATLESARGSAEQTRRTAAAALGVLAGLVPRAGEAATQREQVAELPAAIAACGRTLAAEVEAEETHRRLADAALEHAGSLARTAAAQRADRAALGDVPAAPPDGPVALGVPVGVTVGAARAAWESASLAYRREVSESALASSLQEAGHALTRARDQLAELPAAVRADAAALLDSPDGLDAAARSAATARAAADHEQAREAHSRAGAEIHLAQAELAEHTGDGEGDGDGETRTREDALLAAAAADREAVAHRERHDAAVAAARAAAAEQAVAKERAAELRHALDLLGVRDTDPAPDPFAGSVDEARAAVEEARSALAAAEAEAQRSRRALEKLGQELALWASADRFAGVKDAVRDRFRTGDLARDVLPDAEQLAADLDLFAANLHQRIEELEEHKSVVVTAMVGMVRQALKSLSRAQSLSELPDTLGEWAGQRFLDVGPRSVVETADAVVRDRCARLVDTLTARGGQVPRGHDLLWQATNAVVGEGNWKARVLKPSTTLAVERVSVERMRKWSGGEKVTISLLLFCMIAKLRASSRGRDRPGLGALPLDNPLGKANYVVFLNLQRKVAAANGIQLIFLTGVGDMKAVGRFPNVIRMRNTRSRNREYVSIDDRQVAATDPAGVVDATRVWRADPTLTLL